MPVDNALPLLKRTLVQSLVVVCLGYVLGLRAPLEIKESRVTVRVALLVLHVAEDVEQVLVVVLRVFDLLGQVILRVAIRTTLPRLVDRVFLGTHGHNIFDSLLDDCTV